MAANEREITNLAQAMRLLDEWIDAYEALRCANVQLMHRYIKLQRSLEHANAALENWEYIATTAEREEIEPEQPFA